MHFSPALAFLVGLLMSFSLSFAQSSSQKGGSLFDAQTEIDLHTRYRSQQDQRGRRSHNRLQARARLDVQLSFFKDFIRLDFLVGTGNDFTTSWTNTGVGDGEVDRELHVKRLSFVLLPEGPVAVEAGSMAPEMGEGTSATYLNHNGYISGYRVRVNIDETSLTSTIGHVGEFRTPHFFDRIGKMDELSYYQLMIKQEITSLINGSLDFSSIGKTSERDGVASDNQLMRGAFTLKLHRWVDFIDRLRAEYARGHSDNPQLNDYDLLGLGVERDWEDIAWLNGGHLSLLSTYLYRTYDNTQLEFFLDNRGFQGHSFRFKLEGRYRLSEGTGPELLAGFDHIQSLDFSDQYRFEFYLGFTF